MSKKYDVVGIGNALVDLLVEVPDDALRDFGLEKGRMHLVDEAQARGFLTRLREQGVEWTVAPGGSCANTIAGIAKLGGRAAFYGKVGEDEFGNHFEETLKADGVVSGVRRSPSLTGHALTFVTPDGQRTFAVQLGAALGYAADEVATGEIAASRMLHIEGYVFDGPVVREAALKAMACARSAGVKVSLDLSDPWLVERQFDLVQSLLEHQTDILFANEEEASALTGKSGEHALREIGERVELTVVKCGAEGSWLKRGREVVHVDARPSKAVDTTGAGDLYAAAVLHGLSQGWSLEQCGNVASHVAGLIVEQLGARPAFDLQAAVRELANA